MIKFKIIDFEEINSMSNSFPPNALDEYLNGGRQDILYNVDIFCENVRSKEKKEKDFSLFKRVDYIDDSVILVFSVYLELFEYFGKMSEAFKCIDFYSKKYPNNKIVFSWNHDVDFKKYNYFVNQYPNVRILNYNTSSKSTNDIIIPFWSFNTDQLMETKDKFCSFIGTINNQTRVNLQRTFSLNQKYIFNNGLSNDEYRKFISSSIFTFAPRGLGLSSYRFFECLHLGSIPVLFADSVVLPFLDEINYNNICVIIPENKSNDFMYVDNILNDIMVNKSNLIIQNILDHRNKFTLLGVQEYIHSKLN